MAILSQTVALSSPQIKPENSGGIWLKLHPCNSNRASISLMLRQLLSASSLLSLPLPRPTPSLLTYS